MSKFYKSALILIGIFVFIVCAYSFFDRQFKLSNIQGEWPLVTSSKITNKQQAFLHEVFSQPFHYLDRGKQSFVFVSEDQKYVLKFFDNRCLRSGSFSFLFTIDEEHCSRKLVQLFEGYRVAKVYDESHTGLLFLQLVPDPSYHYHVNVIDRLGFKHEIDLSEVPFVLQEKAIPLRELITALLNKGNVAEAEHRLHQIIDMYLDGYQRGIVDLDHNFMYNTGFVGDRPLRIDLGRLQLSDQIKNPAVYNLDLQKIAIERLGDWLERHFPKYRQKILEDMRLKLQQNVTTTY